MPKKSPAEASPQANCLQFSFDVQLLGQEAAARIGEHYAQACAFEARWRDLCDRRAELLRRARETTYGLLQSTAEELREEKLELQRSLDALFASRKALCEDLLPLAAQAAERAEAEHERTLAGLAEALEAKGISLQSMPALAAGPRAAERQLRFRLENDDLALASLGRKRQIQQATGEVGASAEAPAATVSLYWPGVPEESQSLAKFLGIDDEEPQYRLRLSVGRFA